MNQLSIAPLFTTIQQLLPLTLTIAKQRARQQKRDCSATAAHCYHLPRHASFFLPRSQWTINETRLCAISMVHIFQHKASERADSPMIKNYASQWQWKFSQYSRRKRQRSPNSHRTRKKIITHKKNENVDRAISVTSSFYLYSYLYL